MGLKALNKDRLYVVLHARGGKSKMPDGEDRCEVFHWQPERDSQSRTPCSHMGFTDTTGLSLSDQSTRNRPHTVDVITSRMIQRKARRSGSLKARIAKYIDRSMPNWYAWSSERLRNPNVFVKSWKTSQWCRMTRPGIVWRGFEKLWQRCRRIRRSWALRTSIGTRFATIS